ncbi:hypothetical protein HOLleu_25475 [Holothuria leucospilota]|uniref:Uncharacterized protein n=1 Tax=Holothuria leucospilota TaxID=206669 RepID=A0A9Q1BT25_HOLLE|nr:hypothetical protein HOLleu_25475 [Holothuria leucospilota]
MIEERNLNGVNYIVGTTGEEGSVFLFQFFPDKEVKPIKSSALLPSVLDAFIRGVPDPIVIYLIKTLYTVVPKDLVDEKRDDFFHEALQFWAIGFYV